MAYRTATSRAASRSPVGVENHGRGTKLSINTNLTLNGNGKLNGEASSFKPHSATKYLLHGSTPDEGPLIVSSNPEERPARRANANGKMPPSAIGTTNGISPTRTKVHFTTDIVPGSFMGTHYVKVTVAKDKFSYLFDELEQAFDWSKLMYTSVAQADDSEKKINMYCAFDDLRRVGAAFEQVHMVESTADVSYVTQSEVAAAQKDRFANQGVEPSAPSFFYDGQVMFYAQFDGPVTASKADGLENKMMAFAQQFGELVAFGELDAKNGMARFRAEYYSIKASKKVMKKCTAGTPADVDSWLVTATELPDLNSASNSDKGTGIAGRGTPFGSANGESPTYVSPTGRTAWSVDNRTCEVLSHGNNGSDRATSSNGGARIMHPVRHYPSPPPGQFSPMHQQSGFVQNGRWSPHQFGQVGSHFNSQQYSGGYRGFQCGRGREFNEHSQTVDEESICRGIDVRTTIMLRNLPNQMTCHTLKELLDSSNHGEYDFSYVRIDYQKGASVGYGFVNFTHPEAIIKFMRGHVGRPWMPELSNPRGAARLAEISYATVQGYESCVEKFRNSSVMTEFKDYRPKLWYTKESSPSDEFVGHEKEFPAVNNLSKHQRSLANATQVGLFPPQARRMLGGHRSVRSQYDRGTTAQQQEDLIHRMQHMQMQQSMQASANLLPPAPMNWAGAPTMQQQNHFAAPFGLDMYGNPMYPGAGAMVPANTFPAANMQHMSPANAFNGNINHVNHFNGQTNTFNGYANHGGRRHSANNQRTSHDKVPRLHRRPSIEEHYRKMFEGDVDARAFYGEQGPQTEN